MDARAKLAGGEHSDDGPHAGAAFLDQLIPGMNGELPHRRRISARPECRLEIKLGLSSERAVNEKHAAGGEQRNVAGNAGSTDRIDDGVDPPAAGDLHDAFAHFLNRAIDDVVSAQLPSEAGFFFAAHDAYDREVCRSREVNERVSHAARGRIDE